MKSPAAFLHLQRKNFAYLSLERDAMHARVVVVSRDSCVVTARRRHAADAMHGENEKETTFSSLHLDVRAVQYSGDTCRLQKHKQMSNPYHLHMET